MKRNQLILLAAILLLAVGITLWLAKGVTTTPDKIRVGHMSIAAHLPVIAAEQDDFFSRFKLTAELKSYADTPSLMQALIDDRIDVAFQVTPDIAWTSAAEGKDYYVYFVAQSTSKSPIDGLFALEEQSAETLKGSVVGVFPGPTASAMMKKIMQSAYGLSPGDYELRPIPPPLQLNLLANGEIRALFTYEPLGTLAIERAAAISILPAPVETYIIDPWNGGVGIFSEAIVKYRPKVACNFAAAIAASVKHIEETPQRAAALMSELQPGMTEEIAKKVPLTNYFFTSNRDVAPGLTRDPSELSTLLEKQLALYVSLGVLEQGGRLQFLTGCDE